MNDTQIIAAVNSAVALHKDSKKNLISRMEALLAPLPNSLTLDVDGHKIAYRTVYGTCSQWAPRYGHHTTGSSKGYVIDDCYVFARVDVSFFDGSNHQDMFGRNYLTEDHELRELPAKTLREIAKALPARLLEYVECCKSGAVENDALAKA